MTTRRTRPGRFLVVVLNEDARIGTRRVDYAQGVIRGVKILGTESPNGIDDMPEVDRRIYSREALSRAKSLYEGCKVNVDHPPEPGQRRNSADGFGILRNVQVREDGLYGDLHFLKSHPMAKRVCEAAESMPSMFGLSHNADARGERKGDAFVVTEITKVRSVDLVRDPATTKGLFEGRDMGKPCKESMYEEDDDLPGPADASDMEEDDLAPDEPMPDEEMGDVPDDAGDEHDHACSMLETFVKQYRDGVLDFAALKDKVGKVLNILQNDDEEEPVPDEGVEEEEEGYEKAGEKENTTESEDEDEDEDDKAMKEELSVTNLARRSPGVRRLVEQLDALKTEKRLALKRSKARKLCESVGLPKEARTRVFMDQLLRAPSDRAMKQLVEDRMTLSRKPRSHGRANGAPEVTPKEFASKLRKGPQQR